MLQWTTGGTSLSELIIFNTTLSSIDRLKVEDYLNKKWLLGLPVTSGVNLPNMNFVTTATSTLDLGASSTIGSISVNGASTVLNLNHAQSTTLKSLSGDGTLKNIDTVTPASLTFSATGGTATFSGTILSGGANGIVNLTMSGTGTQNFTGPGTVSIDTLSATGGTLSSAGSMTVNTADFSAGTGVVNAISPTGYHESNVIFQWNLGDHHRCTPSFTLAVVILSSIILLRHAR